MENRLFNSLTAFLFFVAFIFALMSGGLVNHIFAVVCLANIVFALYKNDVVVFDVRLRDLISLDLEFLNGSEFLTTLAILAPIIALGNLLQPGLLHFGVSVVAVAVTVMAGRAALTASKLENDAPSASQSATTAIVSAMTDLREAPKPPVE